MLFFKKEKPQPATKDSDLAVGIKKFGGFGFAGIGGLGVTLGIRKNLPFADHSIILNLLPNNDNEGDGNFQTMEERCGEEDAESVEVDDADYVEVE